MKKTIRIDKRANKEIQKFPALVHAKIYASFKILERDGRLEEPLGKKIDESLFEMRIKFQGQWRILYAYLVENFVIILSAFQKKTQKTPLSELQKAKQRLKSYQL